jgi:SAM-dependent methyltransferase
MCGIAGQVRRLRQVVRPRRQPHPDLVKLTPEDRRYMTSLFDDRLPLPAGAERELREDNPRLHELRDAYETLDVPALDHSRWRREAVRSFLDLRYFRGETLITWHYRELPRITMLKYFVYANYVRDRASPALLETLAEDGAFGCWTYTYPGFGTFSRDLLDSLNEISFLERELELSRRDRFSVLDIGAGYGRLAHRIAEAYPNLTDYACVDAIPEATFLSEYYLRFRGVMPPARAISLDQVDAVLDPGSFDLAVNIHSFSECTYAAVEWWLGQLRRLRVPRLLVIPNHPTELLTLEADGTHRDFAPLLAEHGYRLDRVEPVLADEAVRDLVRIHDRFHLFSLAE